MSINTMGIGIASVLLAGSVAICVTRAQDAAPVEPCVFDRDVVRNVAPLRKDYGAGLVSTPKLRGAQLYVAAREGLTAEWLTRSVQRSLLEHAAPGGSAACQPAVSKVHVHVVSGGNGFWVQLGASDDRSSEALLRWAKGIVPAKNYLPDAP